MASAWGSSWGRAFGNAWGLLTDAAATVLSGGGIPAKDVAEKPQPVAPLPQFHPWIHFPVEVSKAVVEVVAETAKVKEVSKDLQLAKTEKAFKAWLDAQELVWLDQYARLLELEIDRRQQEETEADIAFVLAILASE